MHFTDMSLLPNARPARLIAPSAAVGLPAPASKIQITVPWSDVTGWTAHGTDAKGRPVRQSGTHRGRCSGSQAGTASFELTLPQGFQGVVQLQGVDRLPLGRIRLDMTPRGEPKPHGAPPGTAPPSLFALEGAAPHRLAAHSHELEVRWLGPTELLVDRVSHQTQCYLQLPPRMGVRGIVLQPLTGSITQLANTARGASFSLPASFRGRLVAQDAAGVPQLALRVRHLFPTTRGVDIEHVADNYRASISRPGGILQISVLPGSQRISIA